MRSLSWAMLASIAALVVGCCLIRKEEPLLLEDNAAPPAKGLLVNNSRCHVCHLNYADEKLAVQHVKANVGCEKCHGFCDDHCGDEEHLTPPDIMYPKPKVNPSCIECHPREKLNGDRAHELFFVGIGAKVQHCTDCHGRHRLATRRSTWDKVTRELLPNPPAARPPG